MWPVAGHVPAAAVHQPDRRPPAPAVRHPGGPAVSRPGRVERRRQTLEFADVGGPDEPLLVVEDLHTSFRTGRGTVRAVDGVSLSSTAGKTLGIVGESGSGKTVLSRSIMGLLPLRDVIRSGTVHFAGHELTAMDPRPAAPGLGRRAEHDLPGPDDRAQPGQADRAPDHRVAPPPPGHGPGGGQGHRHRAAPLGRASPRPRSGSAGTRSSCPAGCANG